LATVAMLPHVPYAVDAHVTDLALHVADGTVSVGTAGESRRSVDRSRTLASLTPTESLGSCDTAAAFDIGVLAAAAQLQGLGRTLLDTTVEYAQQRKQFGRAIGSFQAVKHHLAEVAVALEMARPLLHGAALAVRDGLPSAARDVSAAKVACGDAAYLAARTALQVHGAIGYTQEYDLSLWITKVRALVTAWGTPDEHRARVVAALESEAS
ncbi:acyl-CoA dehydrogenase family protein, partial [Rhodococcus sp. R1101]|uniref:acyl-CoA dehydrogenase family protein n=1 Tax=Rhodococcus sp. R1101 TaxID=1170698 RepID=UPI00036567EC